MRGNLSVRVNDGYTDRMVTSKTTGLRFRKTAPGGHHSASCTISVPRDTFRDLGPADKLYIYDSRTARTVWEGYTENPGATDGPAGQSYELSASGGMILTQDMATPVVFLERALDDSLWVRTANSVDSGGTIETLVNNGGYNALKMQFPSGIPVALQTQVAYTYKGIQRAGMRVGYVSCGVQAGKSDTGYRREIDVADAGGVQYLAQAAFFDTPLGVLSGSAGVGAFPLTAVQPIFRIWRQAAATNVADDSTWNQFYDLYIRAILSDASGVDITATGAYTGNRVYAHEVVNHLLGRLLPQMDGGAVVVAGTYPITQLTYHDGATPQKILDDLSLFEPDYLWEVLETGANGKHRFAYRAWPTTPRYEISTKDGYNEPGGEVDLCNRVIVYYTDVDGAKQSETVTQSVPELGSRTRDAQAVTLPEGLGSAANAQRVGAMILAQKTADAPKAATAVVRRRVMDSLRGCMVMPWEIEPGYLVRVRETGEDLRLSELEYTDADCSATLTLGTPVLSVEQILARLG